MKKIVGLLSGVLLASSLNAYDGKIKSLVGVEAGYGQFEYNAANEDNINQGRNSSSEDFGTLGLKIGAQTKEFRIFLGAEYYVVDGAFDYANSFGGSFQYLIYVNNNFNFFFGINGGLMNVKVVDNSIGKSFEYSDPYFGGDVGINYDFNDKLGLEVGFRYININADNTQYYTDDHGDQQTRTYTIDTMMHLYTSLIFKFNMD
jgi:hypothetical protein